MGKREIWREDEGEFKKGVSYAKQLFGNAKNQANHGAPERAGRAAGLDRTESGVAGRVSSGLWLLRVVALPALVSGDLMSIRGLYDEDEDA